MKIQQASRSPCSSRGITLVEVLIVISVLAIILSFAIPSASGAAARAELRAATENLEYSISAARNVARITESPVTLHISASGDQSAQIVSLAQADAGSRGAHPDMQPYPIPDSVDVLPDRPLFLFDRRGLVDRTGQIRLVSKLDPDLSATLEVR